MSAVATETASQKIQALREDYQRVLAEYGPSSGYTLDAFNRLSSGAGALGFPLSGLRRYSADEGERFFSRTVPGPDGHTYWHRAEFRFKRNDGGDQHPRRWWWEREHGVTLSLYDEFTQACGDRRCITPAHQTVGPRTRKLYTDEQMIGAIQVWAMRHGGRPPTSRDWDRDHMHPVATAYKHRFGTWQKAVRAAGFTYHSPTAQADADACIRSVRFLHDLLGRWPSWGDYTGNAAALRAAGLPSSRWTITRYCGGIVAARRMAGAPE